MTAESNMGTNQDFLDLLGLSDSTVSIPMSKNNDILAVDVNPKPTYDAFNDLLNDEVFSYCTCNESHKLSFTV